MKKIDYVNILQGTKSNKRYSNGNTLPFVQAPNGMAAFTIQTNGNDDPWFFHPEDNHIEGFRLSHQPSPWIKDYGQLLFMPQSGDVSIGNAKQSSSYNKKTSILKPNFMQVHLNKDRIEYSLVPTTRGCMQQIKFSKSDGHLIIRSYDENKKKTRINIDIANNIVTGFTSTSHSTTIDNFKEYFYLEFDNNILEDSFIFDERNDKIINEKDYEDVKIGAIIKFDLTKSKEVNLCFAISYISIEQAKLNYKRELQNKKNEELRSDSERVWEKELSKIEVKSDDDGKIKTFYSSMYRTLIFPRKFYEYDSENKIVHFSPATGNIKEGYMYTDIGFWDVFRTLFPLMTITRSKEVEKMIEGFLNYYKESGWLPKWISPSERGAMPGTLVDSVLTDAITKKIPVDKELAFEAMLKNATVFSDNELFGRLYLDEYLKHEYVTNNHEENVNITQDYSYSDFCISQVAKILRNEDLYEKYSKMSMNYRKLVDIKYCLMRGKDELGNFTKEFDPLAWGGDYCEGSAYQNSWFVPHDIKGYANLVGGKEKFLAKIDELFNLSPDFNLGTYKKEIHEMTEMANADFGQCAISNQPSFHIPYLFAELGDKSKSNIYIKKILDEGFSHETDGFPGDEDNGSMAAWYILSSIGLYQFTPGIPEYLITYCQWDNVVINLENDKKFKIDTNKKNNEIDISNNTFNNKIINDRIDYEKIINGGELNIIYI